MSARHTRYWLFTGAVIGCGIIAILSIGLAQVRFHNLRHSAATLLLEQGIHPKIVSELLGHTTIRVTMDIYSHVLPDMQREAVASMERLLTPKPPKAPQPLAGDITSLTRRRTASAVSLISPVRIVCNGIRHYALGSNWDKTARKRAKRGPERRLADMKKAA